jgi:hypothetical protein
MFENFLKLKYVDGSVAKAEARRCFPVLHPGSHVVKNTTAFF